MVDATRRAGTHFETCVMLGWVPDRAHVPDGEIISGASGMTALVGCDGMV